LTLSTLTMSSSSLSSSIPANDLTKDQIINMGLIPTSLLSSQYDYWPWTSNQISHFHYNFHLLSAIKHTHQYLATLTIDPAFPPEYIQPYKAIPIFSKQISPLA
jgi:hypothetical protein